MKGIFLAAALWATPAGAAMTATAPAEPETAARLEARVNDALERMLGAGRASVAVEVRGERLIRREATQVVGPGGRAATEELQREESFKVAGQRAWLVLDSRLDDAKSAEAARVTGEILALDVARGDELNVIRTAFTPAWRAAFSRPRDAGALLLTLIAGAALVVAAWLLARAATRSSGALADAIVRARPEPATPTAVSVYPPSSPPPAPAPAAPRVESSRRIELLPPLGPESEGPEARS